MIKVFINNNEVVVNENATILEAAKKVGIEVPTLCHLNLECFNKEHRVGSCRICVVEVEGRPNLAPSCCTPVAEGMKVTTNSIKAINARRTILDLIMSNHPKDCLICEKNLECDLQTLCMKFGLHHQRYEGARSHTPKDLANQSIARDPDKCIMCRRCETACNEIQEVGILCAEGRGFGTVVTPTLGKPLAETQCTFCGQCVSVCPTGALTEMSQVRDVWAALNDKTKTVIVQTAPAVRVAIGEEFGSAPGTVSTGKLVAALRFLGFQKVFDTDWSADLTIMEEAHELMERVKKNENLPILTSCCPGWVKFFEHQFPDLLHVPSTCKSPQQMFGAIAKTFYAEKIGVKPEDMVVVSVMPCLAKKYEANRDDFKRNGVKDVDYVLSTRELAKMLKEAGCNWDYLKDAEYDNPLGESSGAGVIFGASGGVLEAALRTAADWISGKDLPNFDFKDVRSLTGIKEATVEVAGLKLNVAISSGLGNAKKLLEKIRKGEAHYHAIEIMACSGGCLNGGGQPYIHGKTEILKKRQEAIYREDSSKMIRKSHENPSIKAIYKDFLGKPGGHKAHELLHTKYTPRKKM